MTPEEKKKRKDFKELWEMGMKFQREVNPHWQQRFCPKLNKPVPFSELMNMECWKCEQYICNEGNCDCI